VCAVVALAGVVACGGDDDDAAPGGSETTATTVAAETTTTEPTTTGPDPAPSGQPLALGTEAPIVDGFSGEQVGYITVRSVAVDPGCSNPAAGPPENGHFLVVDLTLGVYEDADDSFSLTGLEFEVEGPDGETESGVGSTFAALGCDADRQTSTLADIRPGYEYEGPIVLDSAHTSGTLVFAPPGLDNRDQVGLLTGVVVGG
jgi:hypothetical protein